MTLRIIDTYMWINHILKRKKRQLCDAGFGHVGNDSSQVINFDPASPSVEVKVWVRGYTENGVRYEGEALATIPVIKIEEAA